MIEVQRPQPVSTNLNDLSSLLTGLILLVSLGLLVAGGELLVGAASRLAGRMGISSLVVGLTVVAFGTSAPELGVALSSVYQGASDIGVGNIVGSNIFNILFIMGAAAVVAPLSVESRLIKVELPLMVGASGIMWWFASSETISRGEGGLLFLMLVIYVTVCIRVARKEPHESQKQYSDPHEPGQSRQRSVWLDLAVLVAGFALLVFGSRWLVDAAVTLAKSFGVSDSIIGLTIVALGTSLPEVVTSVVASYRGHRDIAVGNVVGSNLFNIGSVLGLCAAVSPSGLPVAESVLRVDLPVMFFVALLCLPIFLTGRVVSRVEGFLLLGLMTGYWGWLIATG
ncbi:MAG: calcium/sodium antiporter [Planctomycetota bacterium]